MSLDDDSVPQWMREMDDPPTVQPGDIDTDLLLRLLTRVEADAHRRGWDNTPTTLLVCYDTRDGDTAEIMARTMGANPKIGPGPLVGHYRAQQAFPPRMLDLMTGKPWQPLRTFAMNLAYGESAEIAPAQRGALRYLKAVLRSPGVIGMALLAEAWKRESTPEQHEAEAAEATAQGKSFVDYSTKPDAIECRNVYMVDLHDRVHVVNRDRGDKPVVTSTAHGLRTMITPGDEKDVRAENDAPVRGEITTSLRILCDMITGRTPPPEQFHEHYPTGTAALKYEQSRRYGEQPADPDTEPGTDPDTGLGTGQASPGSPTRT